MTLFLRASDGASGPPSRLRRLTAYSGLVSFALCCSIAGANRAEARPHHKAPSSLHHPALIKVSTAKLRSGPGTDKKATALLDEGRSAIVVGKKDGWVKVRLDSGREGWLRHDLVEVAKANVHDDSNEDEFTSSRKHHRKHAEDDDDSGATRSRSHHKVTIHLEVASETRSTRRHPSSGSSHHIAHVTEIHGAASARTSRVTSLSVAMAQGAGADVTRTTELKLDSDGEEPGRDTATTDAITADQGNSGTSESILRNVSRGDRLVRSALAYRGTPYRMGATGDGAFDCSGFTMYLFGKEGSALPRTAAEQYDKGETIQKDKLQPGDLVFFRNTYKSGISHVGIYIGNNSFVHASGYGRGVRVDSLDAPFYINHWAGARRPR